jgi:hypothetical protein
MKINSDRTESPVTVSSLLLEVTPVIQQKFLSTPVGSELAGSYGHVATKDIAMGYAGYVHQYWN